MHTSYTGERSPCTHLPALSCSEGRQGGGAFLSLSRSHSHIKRSVVLHVSEESLCRRPLLGNPSRILCRACSAGFSGARVQTCITRPASPISILTRLGQLSGSLGERRSGSERDNERSASSSAQIPGVTHLLIRSEWKDKRGRWCKWRRRK